MNESSYKEIIKKFLEYNFYGFNKNNTFFMVQKSFHGISILKNKLYYKKNNNNKRLHNHGQMFMQKIMNRTIFAIEKKKEKKEENQEQWKKNTLTNKEFNNKIKHCKDLISYSIEDIDYFQKSIDVKTIALALKLEKQGINMLMEIVKQDKKKPKKGGALFYDTKIKKNIIIESFMLKDYPVEKINYLNRNFNHYINPSEVFNKVKKKGINIPFEVKETITYSGNKKKEMYIYACPVQGDVNFLVECAYFRRKKTKEINAWKKPEDTKNLIEVLKKIKRNKAFMSYIEDTKEINKK